MAITRPNADGAPGRSTSPREAEWRDGLGRLMADLDEALQHVLEEVRSRLGDTIKDVEQQGVERIAQLDADEEATREPAEAVEQAIQEEVPERRAAAEQ